jgi:glutamate synthase (NADPH) large chain
VLTNGELAKLKGVTSTGVFESQTLSTLYDVSAGDPHALTRAVDALCDAAANAVDDGYNIIVLSDRGVSKTSASIPSLLALAAVQQRLVREGIRTHTGLVVEAADVREIHHVACLIGFGAAAVNPWLALDTLHERATKGFLNVEQETAQAAFIKAIDDGLLKVMSKMGISTLQSYRGAQIFEAIGIDLDVIARHFTGTPARIGGFDMAALDRENRVRHARGYPMEAPGADDGRLPTGGLYLFRRDGEKHRWSPPAVHALQKAARSGDFADYESYAKLADDDLSVLRALLTLDAQGNPPVPLEEVEPASEIVKRFGSGAISLGAISPEAHETLAIAMNRLGARSNSGEGGEEPHRYVRDENGDSRQTAIKQVASGRFGVTTEYLVHADEIQIKVAQGAKPGEGGQLPGDKVDERIGRVRHAVPGTTLISPPPHHDIYSIEDLKQLIWDLASTNPSVRIGVKLVSEQGVGTVAAGCVKAGACAVTIAGFSGGTGASPLSSLKHAGNPWELGLAEAQQVLLDTGLRNRVRVNVDGGIRTGRDVIVAALMGADEFGLATGALIAGGCVMQRRCHLNTCGVGVATQNPELRKKFVGKPEHIVNYFLHVAEDVRRIMASLGVRKLDELIGRIEWLRPRTDLPSRIARVDLSPLLRVPTREDGSIAPIGERGGGETRVDVSTHLDHEILKRATGVLDAQQGPGARSVVQIPVRNTDRAVGAFVSGEIARRFGSKGLLDDTLHVELTGSAGQSFGAFLAHGVTLELFGEANDGVAKGLSGGRVIVRPPKDATWPADENVILGNVALYGATSGELYVSGVAGERFAVRNSGARAVVEGVGDHGCEYMTGGAVVVLGKVGRNFAAGMSGGLAFVLDPKHALPHTANLASVELLALDDDDAWLVQGLLERHHAMTGSVLARATLATFEIARAQFVKVLPHDYKRALALRREKAKAAAVAAAE